MDQLATLQPNPSRPWPKTSKQPGESLSDRGMHDIVLHTEPSLIPVDEPADPAIHRSDRERMWPQHSQHRPSTSKHRAASSSTLTNTCSASDSNRAHRIVLFLANTPMLENDVGRARRRLRLQHEIRAAAHPQGRGGVEEAPAPHPEFTMRRRSATKLPRQVESWHGFLARESYVELATWTGGGCVAGTRVSAAAGCPGASTASVALRRRRSILAGADDCI